MKDLVNGSVTIGWLSTFIGGTEAEFLLEVRRQNFYWRYGGRIFIGGREAEFLLEVPRQNFYWR